MAEESKEEEPPQQKPPAEGSKAVVGATAPASVARPPVLPTRPAQVAPTTPPASRPVPPRDSGRRGFLKALFVVGAILSMVPFVPWGTFLSSTVSGGSGKRKLGQLAVVDNFPDKYGQAAGKTVNVKRTDLFPPNGHWVVTYPSSGDLTLDTENPDTFQKFELIRLPESLGGASKKATDFVAFSKVCVHLWCSPNYNPATQQFACPCHGSTYEVPDGKAVAGPAFLQPFPTNAIPMLTLQADAAGDLWIFYPNRDPSLQYPNDLVGSVEANGDLGYGRDYASYNKFIKPRGELQGDPKTLNTEVS